MKIVFFGTPAFAEGMLDALVSAGHEVVCAVTQPDKPVGRKQILTPPPVKTYALSHGIDVLQPEKLRNNPEFEAQYAAFGHEAAVVASYGKIVPAYVLHTPPRGCLNVHGSLLPDYRGAAPIQRAILEGREKTGVTIMQMDEGIDTGDMLLAEEVEIGRDDTYAELHDKMVAVGRKLLVEAIEKIDSLTPGKQDDSLSRYAAKITDEDCLLDFSRSARAVHDNVRGLSPSPLAYAYLNGKKVKFVRTALAGDSSGRPGEVTEAGKKLVIACGEGSIELLSLIPEGKKQMNAGDFVRGRNVAVGDVFTTSR